MKHQENIETAQWVMLVPKLVNNRVKVIDVCLAYNFIKYIHTILSDSNTYIINRISLFYKGIFWCCNCISINQDNILIMEKKF